MNGNIKYNDIINLPHYVSKKRSQMSLEARSAQFSPFAALTGYDDAIKETSRLTKERKYIEDCLKEILDSKLQIIKQQISLKPKISFTYFVPDEKKSGGSYMTVVGCVKKIDEYNELIVLDNKIKIPILEIIKIEGEIFKNEDL